MVEIESPSEASAGLSQEVVCLWLMMRHRQGVTLALKRCAIQNSPTPSHFPIFHPLMVDAWCLTHIHCKSDAPHVGNHPPHRALLPLRSLQHGPGPVRRRKPNHILSISPSSETRHTSNRTVIQWQRAYDTLGEYVFANEPNTLTYYFGIPLEHAADHSRTDSMLAFEAYRSRADLYDVHIQSDVMKDHFLPSAGPAMATGLDLTHFSAVGGFLDRGGRKKECGVMHDVEVRCHDAAARRELLGALRMLCGLVEAEQARSAGEEEDGEVLTFLGLESLDDEVGARIFARYKDLETWEAWMRHPAVKTFWEAVKSNVQSMEGRPYVPNGKGWLWK